MKFEQSWNFTNGHFIYLILAAIMASQQAAAVATNASIPGSSPQGAPPPGAQPYSK